MASLFLFACLPSLIRGHCGTPSEKPTLPENVQSVKGNPFRLTEGEESVPNQYECASGYETKDAGVDIILSCTLSILIVKDPSMRCIKIDHGIHGDYKIIFGILLSIAAGMSTLIGTIPIFIAPCLKHSKKLFLACGMAFAAGIMIFISLYEIIGKSENGFTTEKFEEEGSSFPKLFSILAFALGIAIMIMLEFVVHWIMPESHQKHDDFDFDKIQEEMEKKQRDAEEGNDEVAEKVKISAVVEDDNMKRSLHRTGVITAIAIGIHNIPEGMVTFVGAFDSLQFATSLVFAISMHNIPEGLCVAVPIFFSTGSKTKAFLWTAISAVTEPFGALIAWGIIAASQSVSGEEVLSADGNVAFGIMFGIVAGMMTFIVINELLPTARRYDPENQVSTYCVIAGMLVMGISIYLFDL